MRIATGFALALALLAAAPASATPVAFRVEAEVRWIPLPLSGLAGPLAVGDPIVLTFAIDTAVGDEYPAPDLSWFARSVLDVRIEFGGSVFAMPNPDRVYSGLSNGAGVEVDGEYGDWLHVRRSHRPCCGHPLPPVFPRATLDGVPIDHIRFHLDVEDPDAEILSSDAIPTHPIDVALAQDSNLDIRWDLDGRNLDGWVTAYLTAVEIVPEPARLVLLGAAAALARLTVVRRGRPRARPSP